MKALFELARFGQSHWLDDLSRTMIASGELQRRVTEEALTGVTVNPAIFLVRQAVSMIGGRPITRNTVISGAP